VFDHAEEAQKSGISQESLLHCFQNHENFEKLKCFHTAFQRIPGLGCSKGVTPLYTLSLHGFYELTKTILCQNWVDVNAHGGPYGSALQAAVVEGNEEIVRMLLKKGADVNTQGGLYGSALQAAAVEENKNILGMLLEKGADLNTLGGVGGSVPNECCGDDSVYPLPNTHQSLGAFVFVATTLLAVFFVSRLPVKRLLSSAMS
jgi:hypothetical protein